MAEDINADELVILTTVDHAFLNYGKENQQAIGKIKVGQLKQYLVAGYFAAGSFNKLKNICVIVFLKCYKVCYNLATRW